MSGDRSCILSCTMYMMCIKIEKVISHRSFLSGKELFVKQTNGYEWLNFISICANPKIFCRSFFYIIILIQTISN